MKNLFSLVPVLLIFSSGFSAPSWERVYPTETYNAITFPTSNAGIAVGEMGKIVRSTDGGINWQPVATPTHATLFCVLFINGTVGYAAGDSGIVLRTADSGKTWQALPTKMTASIHALTYDAKSSTLFAGGSDLYGSFFSSTDGGTSWKQQEIASPFNGSIENCFIDNNGTSTVIIDGHLVVSIAKNGKIDTVRDVNQQGNYAYLLGPSVITMTGTNGKFKISFDTGASWRTAQVPITRTVYFMTYWTLDKMLYASADSGYLFKSADSGKSWSAMSRATKTEFSRLVYFSGQKGFIDINDTLFRTVDDGGSWTKAAIAPRASIFRSIEFFDGSKGIMAAHGGIFQTADGGASWQLALDPGDEVISVAVIGGASAYAMREGGAVLKTRNSGAQWDSILPNGQNGINFTYHKIAAAGRYGIFVGERGDIETTADTGAGWTQISGWDKLLPISSLWSISADTILAGTGGAICRSIDGGRRWSPAFSNNGSSKIRSVNQLTAYAILGSNNTVFKTIDGGKNWTDITPYVDHGFTLRDIAVSSEGRVCAIGNEFFTSVDGGKNWSEGTKTGIPSNLFDFNALATGPAGSIFAVGKYSLIAKLTSGETSWSVIHGDTMPAGDIQDIAFMNGTTGIAVSIRGGSLRTIDGGTTWHYMDVPAVNATQIVLRPSGLGVCVGGASANAAVTRDGGKSWSTINGIGDGTVRAFMANDSVSFILRDVYMNGCAVYKSTDRCRSFSVIKSYGPDTGMVDVAFRNDGVGIMLGTYLISLGGSITWQGLCFISRDFGASWTRLQMNPERVYSRIVFLGSNKMLLFGYDCQANSVDGGKTWDTTTAFEGSPQSFEVVFADSLHGLTSLDTYTSDGGKSWKGFPTHVGTGTDPALAITPNGFIYSASGDAIYRIPTSTYFNEKISSIDFSITREKNLPKQPILIATKQGARVMNNCAAPQEILIVDLKGRQLARTRVSAGSSAALRIPASSALVYKIGKKGVTGSGKFVHIE
jgi:photosystem II stability/assembly factor-like uncharacterized protein